MKPNTYMMVRLAVEGDDTLTESDRIAILAFCKKPVLPTVPPEPRSTAERKVPQEQYLRPRAAAAMLGVNSRTIQRWMRAGILDSSRICGCRRIPLSAIVRLCDEGKTKECNLLRLTDGGQSEGKQAKAS
jgi:hypothetical protein